MIQGVANSRNEAVIRLRLRGSDGGETSVDAIIDTGFSASLTLPPRMVDDLDLVRESSSAAILADGSVREFDICAAEVFWDGQWRQVVVSAVGTQPLLGMRLLAGHKLMVNVVPDGTVEIAPLPGKE